MMYGFPLAQLMVQVVIDTRNKSSSEKLIVDLASSINNWKSGNFFNSSTIEAIVCESFTQCRHSCLSVMDPSSFYARHFQFLTVIQCLIHPVRWA